MRLSSLSRFESSLLEDEHHQDRERAQGVDAHYMNYLWVFWLP